MIQEQVNDYLEAFPAEATALAGLSRQLAAYEALNDRKNFNGHITGSAVILSPDRTRLLLVYHKLFNKWLQPGGHWEEPEAGPWEAARREAVEETGVQLGDLLPAFEDWRIPLDISTHPIKNRPRKHEPAHPHHDFRYAFMAKSEDLHVKSKEVNIVDIAWVPFADARMEYLASSLAKLRHFEIIS